MTRKVTLRRKRMLWGIFFLGAFLTIIMGGISACRPSVQVSNYPHELNDIPTLEPIPLRAGEKLRVVATTSLVADAVAHVGGDRITLTRMLPIGADPHTYQPTPGDVRAVAEADVIFVNGVGLETWIYDLIRQAGGERPIVPVSAGIKIRKPIKEGRHTSGAIEKHGEGDPHVWFDVQNVIIWVRNIERTLSTLDPEGKMIYQRNAETYIGVLEALDAWIVEQVQTIPEERRKLVTSHEALGYFADRYGFEQIGTLFPVTTGAEPSAQELARLEDAIRSHGVPAIFTESTVNPKLAEQIAKDTGVMVVPLYTGSLGEPGSGAGNYVDFMRYNVSAIVAALR